MNLFQVIIGILYILASGQAFLNNKPPFAILYLAWAVGCLCVAYIETL
jgi:hypothetical protein